MSKKETYIHESQTDLNIWTEIHKMFMFVSLFFWSLFIFWDPFSCLWIFSVGLFSCFEVTFHILRFQFIFWDPFFMFMNLFCRSFLIFWGLFSYFELPVRVYESFSVGFFSDFEVFFLAYRFLLKVHFRIFWVIQVRIGHSGVTDVLQMRCGCVVGVLQVYCRRVAVCDVLYCRCVAGALQVCCRCVAMCDVLQVAGCLRETGPQRHKMMPKKPKKSQKFTQGRCMIR